MEAFEENLEEDWEVDTGSGESAFDDSYNKNEGNNEAEGGNGNEDENEANNESEPEPEPESEDEGVADNDSEEENEPIEVSEDEGVDDNVSEYEAADDVSLGEGDNVTENDTNNESKHGQNLDDSEEEEETHDSKGDKGTAHSKIKKEIDLKMKKESDDSKKTGGNDDSKVDEGDGYFKDEGNDYLKNEGNNSKDSGNDDLKLEEGSGSESEDETPQNAGLQKRYTKHDKTYDGDEASTDGSEDENEDEDDGESKQVAATRPVVNRDAIFEDHKQKDRKKRLDFLLKQSEIFSHFVSHNAKDGDKSEEAEKKEMKEIDVGLLPKDAESTEKFLFEHSPNYIKNGELRDYQIRGLNWLISLHKIGINGILADEMGLGKTLQTISFIGYLKHYKKIRGPFLIVVPKSTLQNWINEFDKWCPSLKAVCMIGDRKTRQTFIRNVLLPGAWNVLVTSYEMCLIEQGILKKYKWRYLIIDEAHRIKNEKAKLSGVLRKIKSLNRLLLTGTPLQNNLHELWALLNFLLPDVFNSADDFDDWFNTDSCLSDNDLVERLHKILKPFLLRRLKSEVEKSLKPKKEVNVYVGLTKMQTEWYKKILMKEVYKVDCQGMPTKARLLNVLMQLRKCTNHPYLMDGAEPGPPYTTDVHIVNNCGKMIVLDKLLSKLKAHGCRVLIFSQMTRMLDILEDYCMWKEYEYCRLDGQTAHENRNVYIQEFNAENSTKFIFMLSTRAGGLGINLATADVVIIYDSDWNPQMDLQAMDRAHRIGQKKEVRVFRFVTEKTVEEKIIEKAELKLRLDRTVIQQANKPELILNRHELLHILHFGAKDLFSSDGNDLIDEDIDEILERGEARTKKDNVRFDKMVQDALKTGTGLNSEGKAPSTLYYFEGENYLEKNKLQTFDFCVEPSRRGRKSNYNMNEQGSLQSEDLDSSAHSIEPEMEMESSEDDLDEFAYAKPAKAEHIPPKKPNYPDFQFFSKRLYEIYQLELNYHRKLTGYKVSQKADNGENAERIQKAEQKKIDTAKPLTTEQLEEKERLQNEGFASWVRQDFRKFLKGVEKYGRNDLEGITKEVETKSLEEVTAYSEVFWKRYTELENHERIISQIEKCEAKLQKKLDAKKALDEKLLMQEEAKRKRLEDKKALEMKKLEAKRLQEEKNEAKVRRMEELKTALDTLMSRYEDPFEELELKYKNMHTKDYTKEEDRFLICMLHKLGLDNEEAYEKLHEAVKITANLPSDCHIKSRSVVELQKRCKLLVNAIHREYLEEQKRQTDPEQTLNSSGTENKTKPKAKRKSKTRFSPKRRKTAKKVPEKAVNSTPGEETASTSKANLEDASMDASPQENETDNEAKPMPKPKPAPKSKKQTKKAPAQPAEEEPSTSNANLEDDSMATSANDLETQSKSKAKPKPKPKSKATTPKSKRQAKKTQSGSPNANEDEVASTSNSNTGIVSMGSSKKPPQAKPKAKPKPKSKKETKKGQPEAASTSVAEAEPLHSSGDDFEASSSPVTRSKRKSYATPNIRTPAAKRAQTQTLNASHDEPTSTTNISEDISPSSSKHITSTPKQSSIAQKRKSRGPASQTSTKKIKI